MLTQEKVSDIFERVKKFSSAEDIELIVSGGQTALTRFANNIIHQNVAEENYIVSVRTVRDQKTARSTTNKLDDDSLRRAVEAAQSMSKVQHADDGLLPMASPVAAPPAPPSRFFAATAAMDADARADVVGKIVRRAKLHKLTTAGIVSTSNQVEAIVNSRGLNVLHRQTSSEVSITMLAGDSSGWQKANSPDIARLDPENLAEVAARKALNSAGPRELAPGRYPVILEPAAVLDLVGFMFVDFGGMAVLDQRSFLTDRLGAKVFGDNINIYDDAYHPLQSGAPFDGEGVPRQRIQLVERGTAKNLVYARATAEKMKKSRPGMAAGVHPTGHGFPLPNEFGEAPMNIVFENQAPPVPLGQMIASMERGVLVTRLWYIREVEPCEKILTGMTRDGTFYVENGKIQYGIRNFRFNQGLVELLNGVEQMSEPVRASGEESFDMVVTAMKVASFNFTEVTKF